MISLYVFTALRIDFNQSSSLKFKFSIVLVSLLFKHPDDFTIRLINSFVAINMLYNRRNVSNRERLPNLVKQIGLAVRSLIHVNNVWFEISLDDFG